MIGEEISMSPLQILTENSSVKNDTIIQAESPMPASVHRQHGCRNASLATSHLGKNEDLQGKVGMNGFVHQILSDLGEENLHLW